MSFHTIKKQEKTSKDSVVIRYNSVGQSDEKRKNKFTQDSEVAQKIQAGTQVKYRALLSRSGRLFDPKIHNRDAIDRPTRAPMWNMRDVSKDRFDRYIEYLRTKQQIRLMQAEREI